MGASLSAQISAESNMELRKHVDAAVTKVILDSNFTDLTTLANEKNCNRLVKIAATVFQQNKDTVDLELLRQMLYNQRHEKNVDVQVNTSEKHHNKKVKTPRIKNVQKKCIQISKFYVLFAHLFSCIISTMNPSFKIESNKTEKTYSKEEKESPSLDFCTSRIDALVNGELNENSNGDLVVKPNVCKTNVSKSGAPLRFIDLPGMKALQQLYQGTNLYNERDHKKNQEENARTGIYLNGIVGSLKERLFSEYVQHIKEMIQRAESNRSILLEILSEMFVYTYDDGGNIDGVIISPSLTYSKLQSLVVRTRRVIIKLYTDCEEDYKTGLDIFFAMVQEKIAMKLSVQESYLKKQLEDVMYGPTERYVPESLLFQQQYQGADVFNKKQFIPLHFKSSVISIVKNNLTDTDFKLILPALEAWINEEMENATSLLDPEIVADEFIKANFVYGDEDGSPPVAYDSESVTQSPPPAPPSSSTSSSSFVPSSTSSSSFVPSSSSVPIPSPPPPSSSSSFARTLAPASSARTSVAATQSKFRMKIQPRNLSSIYDD